MSPARFHVLLSLVGVVAALAATATLPNSASAATEYEAKANWLVGFATWTTWRAEDFPNQDAPFIFGILGDNPFGKEIGLLKSKTVQKRKVEVKLFKKVEDVSACHILFISSSEKRDLAKTLKALKDRRILTISDVDGFIQEGGVASIVKKQYGPVVEKIEPDISKEAIESRKWEFEPPLLAAIQTLRSQKQ